MRAAKDDDRMGNGYLAFDKDVHAQSWTCGVGIVGPRATLLGPCTFPTPSWRSG
ncbi:MAG: hypothetical protein ACUVWR_14670 [Anaerolineae bacterium]